MTSSEKIINSFERLKSFCEKENFKGYDPYDGLNSKFFQALPGIRSSKIARLIWIQSFKRMPFNLRPLFGIKKEYNPKGLGLFLNSYCSLYKIEPKQEYLEKIKQLADQLIELITPGYSGACWGYNFDWESRAFFQPKFTPTIVASTFIGYAMLDAYEVLKDEKLLKTGLSVTDFILNDLNRTYDGKGNLAFSYSPLDKSQVLNATLLGARMLARTYSYTKDSKLLDLAKSTIDFCMNHQREDGSWSYSPLPFHQWIDNFRTGYNLECLNEYKQYSGDNQYDKNIEEGFGYYINTFFMEDGRCKYYNNSLYPIDIHAPAQFIVTLSRLNLLQEYKSMADKALLWVIDNMQNPKGYFYFQIKKAGIKTKIPYMRWAQAWMFYAFSEYLKYFQIKLDTK